MQHGFFAAYSFQSYAREELKRSVPCRFMSNPLPLQKKSFTHVTVRMLLGLVAASINLRPSLKKYLKTAEGWR
jgi:hypothetical protein